MTLFNRNKTTTTAAPAPRTTTATTAPRTTNQRNSMFGRKTSPPAPAPVAAPASNRTSMFSRRSSPPAVSPVTSSSPTTTTSKTGGLLRRTQEDPSIANARQRVANAEAAEREADHALMKARESVRQAREEVKRLEAEAAEEARLAKIKQEQAREIGKRAMPLGRHG